MEIDESLVYFEQVIPRDVVDLIINTLNTENVKYIDGEIGNTKEKSIDLAVRNSKISWLNETNWISSIFFHYFGIANRNVWEYDIRSIEGIQISKYQKSGHYSWHADYEKTNEKDFTRKLSASLLVSDEKTYKGGKLQIINYDGEVLEPPQSKGTIIIFDSRIPHRVTPIKKGTRISLVSWALGPRLR